MEDKPSVNWKLLFISSIVIDIVQIFAGLTGFGIAFNEVANVIYAFLYGYYLKRKGINMLSAKKMLRVLSIFGIDEITFGFFPTWTVDTYLMYRSNKNRKDIAQSPVPPNLLRRTRSAPEPLNRDGVRLPRNMDDSVIK